MDDNKEEKKTRVLKEMERKSQDIIKVFNPQSKDQMPEEMTVGNPLSLKGFQA